MVPVQLLTFMGCVVLHKLTKLDGMRIATFVIYCCGSFMDTGEAV